MKRPAKNSAAPCRSRAGDEQISSHCHQPASNDPGQPPKIAPNFMGHPDDLETTVRGLKTSLDIFRHPALARYLRRIVLPDASVATDDEYRIFVRNHCLTSHHPVGTLPDGI